MMVCQANSWYGAGRTAAETWCLLVAICMLWHEELLCMKACKVWLHCTFQHTSQSCCKGQIACHVALSLGLSAGVSVAPWCLGLPLHDTLKCQSLNVLYHVHVVAKAVLPL